MYKDVKCPKCMTANSLPLEIKIGKDGYNVALKQCKSCKVNLTAKEYFEIINMLPKK